MYRSVSISQVFDEGLTVVRGRFKQYCTKTVLRASYLVCRQVMLLICIFSVIPFLFADSCQSHNLSFVPALLTYAE
jgi:hypothetical protein